MVCFQRSSPQVAIYKISNNSYSLIFYLDFLNLIINLLPFLFFTLICIPFGIPPNMEVLYKPSLLRAKGSINRIDWPDLDAQKESFYILMQGKGFNNSTHLRSTIGGFISLIRSVNSATEGTDTGGFDSGDGEAEGEEEGGGGFL